MNVNKYLELVNQKSVTLPDSGKTKVDELKTIVLAQSPLLEELATTELVAKFNDVPYLQVPAHDTAAYVVGGLRVTKSLVNATSFLYDETVEDTRIDVESALDTIMTSRIRLAVEHAVSTVLAGGDTVAGASGNTFSSIVSTINTFPEATVALTGKFLVLCSFDNYINLLESMSSAHSKLVAEGFLRVIPCYGIPNNRNVVLHTSGVVAGFDIKGIEKSRDGASQGYAYVPQAFAGAAKDSTLVKVIDLS